MVFARVLGFVVGVSVVGCGNVKPSEVDAPQTPTPDGPSPTKTAISLDSVDQFSAPSSAFTKVPFKTEVRDDLDEFDPAQSRFTASHPGDYQVCASINGGGNPSLTFELDLYRNGGREKAFAYGTGLAKGCRVIHLGVGDTLEVWLYQNSGSTQAFQGDPSWNWLTIDEQPMLVSIDTIAPTFQATSGGFTKIPYTTALKDTRNEFDPNNHRFTASQAGDYQVCASLIAGPKVPVELDIFINGGRERGIVNGVDAITGCRSVRVAAGDQVEVWMYQSSGATVSIAADPLWDWLTIQQLPTRVSIGNATAFAALNQAFTRILYSAKLFDEHNEFDITSSQFRPSIAGDYIICASIFSGAGIADELHVFKNGTREKGLATGIVTADGCRALRLGTTDAIEINYYQYSGATVTLSPNNNWDWLTVSRLGD